MADQVKAAVRSQFEASLAMLNDCLVKCGDAEWDAPIARYTFWQVAYHTLCFVDCYLSPSNEAFAAEVDRRKAARERDPTLPDLHPLGLQELEAEYPSRRFTKDELLQYAELCREKIVSVLGGGAAGERADSLAAPSGFSWLPFTRLELHLYNLRHVQHHTGQLSAALRRTGAEPRWVKAVPP